MDRAEDEQNQEQFFEGKHINARLKKGMSH
jgi:hypothetical protein